MSVSLKVAVETWALARPFRIARGLRTHSDLIFVTLTDADGNVGVGEGAPIARYGVTAEEGAAQLAAYDGAMTHAAIQSGLPAGAARNALDNALWDLEAKASGRSVDQLIDRPFTRPVRTAETVGIATPADMAAAAKLLDGPGRVIKIKLDGEQIGDRLSAVREAARDATLIVDANEGWQPEQVMDNAELLARLQIQMLEQPVPAGQDAALVDYRGQVPLSADESCHVAADVADLKDIYSILNIKLDKTGGLTEALALEAAAHAAGLKTMVGCMISTSLAMAPAARLSNKALFTDLDGPTWLAEDRPGGFDFNLGLMTAGEAVWGSPRR